MCKSLNFMRFCRDLGIWAIDRDMGSCNGCRSPYCAKTCYNFKFFIQYGHTMTPFEQTLHDKWQALTVDALANEIGRKRYPVDKIRFCTRGEALASVEDIAKVRSIVRANPMISFWIPTKGWRVDALRQPIMDLAEEPNVAILLSVDPSCTPEQWQWVDQSGLSAMFFGNDNANIGDIPVRARYHRCPKTWAHGKGLCLGCPNGCFSAIGKRDRVLIHLRQH